MSTIKADTIVAADGSSPVTLTKQQAAKHWVNYDAVNQTTDGSFNQSSLTDNSTGDFTSGYTNSLSDASDKCVLTGAWNTANNGSGAVYSGAGRAGVVTSQAGDVANSASSINFHCFYGSNATTDGAYACLLYTSPSPRDGLLSRMPSSA